ncbi:MAG: zinc ribbon domain-containing protein [Cycloclasticus sp.]|nr:zinc ribbon domain-containing protein [Cycloclasticus sp.]
MPIYEYQCGACKHRCEALRKISDEPLTKCPECGEDELSKLMSASGFRLKGNGWYETDFKSGKKKNLAEGSSPKKNEKSSDKQKN